MNRLFFFFINSNDVLVFLTGQEEIEQFIFIAKRWELESEGSDCLVYVNFMWEHFCYTVDSRTFNTKYYFIALNIFTQCYFITLSTQCYFIAIKH